MSVTTTAFSSAETIALEREADVGEKSVTIEQIWNETHKLACTDWIRRNDYKQVCLQFPDQYLPHSVAIKDSLKELLDVSEKEPEIKFYILADTSYGSCCVDEIAAAHVAADTIIHFGSACRSKVSRLPVLYMFPQFALEIQELINKLQSIKEVYVDKELFIYLDIGYHHLLEQQQLNAQETQDHDLLAELRSTATCTKLHIEAYPAGEDAKSDGLPTDASVCVFVGEDNLRFFNLALTTKACKWFVYDPSLKSFSEKNPLTSNYIRRRYYYIEKCKDAKTLGIVVATLTAAGYLEVVERLQKMAKSRGIRPQIISVGRLNPAKLANFLEIDCYVLIGCPFNVVYNSRDFYKPIISVFEAEMALNPAWHLKYPEVYVTDFKHLLPEGQHYVPFNVDDVVEQDVSLITGRLRGAALEGAVGGDDTAIGEQQQALIRPKMEVMTTNVGLTFEDRTYKGLEQQLGRTEPAKIQKGRSGIPIRYDS